MQRARLGLASLHSDMQDRRGAHVAAAWQGGRGVHTCQVRRRMPFRSRSWPGCWWGCSKTWSTCRGRSVGCVCVCGGGGGGGGAGRACTKCRCHRSRKVGTHDKHGGLRRPTRHDRLGPSRRPGLHRSTHKRMCKHRAGVLTTVRVTKAPGAMSLPRATLPYTLAIVDSGLSAARDISGSRICTGATHQRRNTAGSRSSSNSDWLQPPFQPLHKLLAQHQMLTLVGGAQRGVAPHRELIPNVLVVPRPAQPCLGQGWSRCSRTWRPCRGKAVGWVVSGAG